MAHALDLVGDRWALLVVRELMHGPKRYTDLVEHLPGIGTNILAARLRDLEGNGVVTRRTLPPPAASKVYELTDYGRELRPAMRELALWGARSLGPPTDRDELFEGWLANAMDIVMASRRAGRPLRVPGRPRDRLPRRRRGRGRSDRRRGRRGGRRSGGHLLAVRGPVPRPASRSRATRLFWTRSSTPLRRVSRRRRGVRSRTTASDVAAVDGSDAGSLLESGELAVEVDRATAGDEGRYAGSRSARTPCRRRSCCR